jgi:hypothetical protein
LKFLLICRHFDTNQYVSTSLKHPTYLIGMPHYGVIERLSFTPQGILY